MATREIRTPSPDSADACEVCGRTLLRGERAHPYLDGGEHRTVCELCTARAVQEGWIREGTMPSFAEGGSRGDRRRSLLGRLRPRREAAASVAEEHVEDSPPPQRPRRAPERPRRRSMEPRHVRAVPTSPKQRMAAAVEAFNGSEHPRTVAGVARSLGVPAVSVRPFDGRPSLVNITVAWELSWYRFEVDLADGPGSVRVGTQGSELTELSPAELAANAVCDEQGELSLAG